MLTFPPAGWARDDGRLGLLARFDGMGRRLEHHLGRGRRGLGLGRRFEGLVRGDPGRLGRGAAGALAGDFFSGGFCHRYCVNSN